MWHSISVRLISSVAPLRGSRGEPEECPMALLSKGLSNFPLPGKEVSAADRRSLSTNVCPDLLNYRKTSRQPSGKPKRVRSGLKSPTILAWHEVAKAARGFQGPSGGSVPTLGEHKAQTYQSQAS